MPLFAKKSAEGSATEVQEIRMTDTFERGRAVEVLSKVVQESRRRAKAIIQEELPEYIEHLASLLERAEVDETSPLWKGHLESEHFAKENIRLIAPGDHSEGERALSMALMLRRWARLEVPTVEDGARIDLEDLLTGAAYILSHMRKNWAKVHDPKSKGDKEEANVLY
ncbi:hypothetical protein QFC22_006442 [Naganishia vaughanmartiniae]|uniref:Uncharacterized protein n=1 Tax=Naganishia vaughanmartiniae TaxID=1424756 RepID=A0ACC2WK51_9TREE|nr:hypothetical protein QFC22_006442 [Naganishia vaughanmartiniae]